MVGGEHSFKISAPQLFRFGIDSVLKIFGQKQRQYSSSYFITCIDFLTDTNRLKIHCIIDPLVQISSKHCQSQIGRAGELKFLKNVHPPPCVTCHVSYGMCHVSHVMWHLSHVICFFTNRLSKLVEGLLSTGPTPSSFKPVHVPGWL